MKNIKLGLIFLAMSITANAQKKSSEICSDDCAAKNKSNGLTCKLATPELRQRKQTVIASLKKQMLQKKELKNGYAYKLQTEGQCGRNN